MIFAIDPGENPGFCVMDDETAEIAYLGTSLRRSIDCAGRRNVSALICEHPKIYPRSKSPPNDIITLAFTAGRLLEAVRRSVESVEFILSPEPVTWKGGSIPKEVHHPKILREHEALRPGEASKWLASVAPSHRHDAIDALGIALWGRMRLRLKTAGAHAANELAE